MGSAYHTITIAKKSFQLSSHRRVDIIHLLPHSFGLLRFLRSSDLADLNTCSVNRPPIRSSFSFVKLAVIRQPTSFSLNVGASYFTTIELRQFLSELYTPIPRHKFEY